ncbi:MAG: aminotransferase class I/II-fold pyridoxal phosphate-dependent enzyme [Rectinemataceae bacterium]|jgi:histidinol-phosphate aminotransferase
MNSKTLRLDANEGRPCLPPAEIAALIDSELLRRYPDSAALEAALADRMDLPPERLIATAGADDAIDRAIRSFGRSGATVLSTAPAFEEYAAAAARSGARYVAVPRAPDGPFPLAALVAALGVERPALVVVASPDNPGGGTISAPELRALAAEAGSAGGAKVLFDVAYADFDEDRGVYDVAASLPGVISTGTFSKACGLAGLRAGWAAGSAADIARLRAAGPPYALGTFAVAAAQAALERGAEAVAAFVSEVRRERPLLQAALAAIGAKTWAGKANFAAAIVPDASAFSDALAGEGIKIRSWPGKPGREGLIRITCPGDGEEFLTLLAALGKIGRLR